MRRLAAFLFSVLLNSFAHGQNPVLKGDSLVLIEHELKKINKNINFTIAPGPEFGTSQKLGFLVVPMIVYNIDKSDHLSPPSSSALMVYFDLYGSWQLAAKQSLYWNKNKWRAFITAGGGHMKMKFFGVGKDREIISNDPSNYCWVLADGGAVSANCYRKIFASLYGGLEYLYESSTLRGEDDNSIEALKLSGITSGETVRESILIPAFIWDSRDNIFWSVKGYYAGLSLQLSNAIFFSSKNYNVITGWANGYHKLIPGSSRLTLAWHAYMQIGWGDMPYNRYAIYTRGDDATGYTRGKYVDRSEITAQTELRYDIWKFIGAGAYLGTGKTFPSFEVFGQSVWLHFGGLRAYLNVIPSRNIRILLDMAFARKDLGFYLGIGQGF
jgi:hypothetical protein